jgi:hypothetical protein
MRRVAKAAVVSIVIVFTLCFFLAPVVFWFGDSSLPVNTNPVYRSLGCATVGLGDEYAPGMFGFRFGCNSPIIFP